MRKKFLPGLIILLAGVLLGAFSFGRYGTPTWEYDFITYQGPFNSLYFDERGADGWEIAAIYKNNHGLQTVVMKRGR
jgi:hypothetical protein